MKGAKCTSCSDFAISEIAFESWWGTNHITNEAAASATADNNKGLTINRLRTTLSILYKSSESLRHLTVHSKACVYLCTMPRHRNLLPDIATSVYI